MTTENRPSPLPGRRRADLIGYVERAGQATVTELAERFDVSTDTIRRDLDQLAESNAVVRTRGGALARGKLATADAPFVNRMNIQRESKERIGAAAAELVSDHETVIVNGGTTALAFAAALTDHHDLTIVTNNLRLPFELPPGAAADLYVIGGSCRVAAMVTIGPVSFGGSAANSAHPISADVAIIGIGGVAPNGSLTTSSLQEAQMMREMIDASARVVVMADSAKLGYQAFAHICDLSRVDALVTDEPLSVEFETLAAEANCTVIVA